jgi:hypothetical protein
MVAMDKSATDTVWYWFLRRGPHGSSRFRWTRGGIHSDIDLLHRVIREWSETDSAFPEKARGIALEAIESGSPEMIRRAIQVLAVVGESADFPVVKRFLQHADERIAADARCFFFERGIKPSSVV